MHSCIHYTHMLCLVVRGVAGALEYRFSARGLLHAMGMRVWERYDKVHVGSLVGRLWSAWSVGRWLHQG